MEIPILDGSALSWASEVEAAGAHGRSHAKWISSLSLQPSRKLGACVSASL